jgi:hypothetical protein
MVVQLLYIELQKFQIKVVVTIKKFNQNIDVKIVLSGSEKVAQILAVKKNYTMSYLGKFTKILTIAYQFNALLLEKY